MSNAEPTDENHAPPSLPDTVPKAAGTPPAIHPYTVLAVLTLVVMTAVTATHWRALSARTLSFDDGQYLMENHLVQNPSWNSIATFFGEVLKPSTVMGYYQPLAMTSLMLDTSLGGRPDRLGPFHRTSLALHVANTALVILLLYLLLGNPYIAAAVGLLFGLHPLTVEPIPWIGERKTVLAAFFALSCFLAYAFYARRPNGKLYAVALGLFMLALLSKPTTTPLPALLLLLDYWPLRRKWNVRLLMEKLPFFGLAGLSAVITFLSQKNTAAVALPGTADAFERLILRPAHNLVFYLSKMTWPRHLSPHYPDPVPFTLAHPMVLAGVIGTVLLIVLVLISLRWTRAVLAGGLFFLIALLPTLGIIGFTNVVASDKFVYLPVLGVLLVLAAGGTALWDRLGKTRNPALGRGVVLAIVLVLGSLEATATVRQLGRWQDTETLYRYMVRLAPRAAPLYAHLGLEMRNQGRPDEALALLQTALELNPQDHYAHNTLGAVLADQGVALTQEARRCMQEARALYTEKKEQEARAKFAEYQELTARAEDSYKQALGSFRAAVRLKPEDPTGYSNLGRTLGRLKRYDEAVVQFRRALERNAQTLDVHIGLAYVLVQQAKRARAEQHEDQAQAKFAEAARCYREAIALNPRFINARVGLGLVLTDQGKYNEAVTVFEDAQLIEPENRNVRAGLRKAQEALYRSTPQP